MGFFFRSSTKVGPFRFNFSRSGVGASVGVKGARLTMTSSGVTYVTVGSHGFYYRETLSGRDSSRRVHPSTPPPSQPKVCSTEDTILSAGSSELVDSSSERLIKQLNERANMFNPAWILYAAAILSLFGLAFVPNAPALPNLPEVTLPSTERSANTIDEYSALTARYGEPTSILYSEVNPLAPVPLGIAQYGPANVKVAFVPSGCVDQYSQVRTFLADAATSSSTLNGELRKVPTCRPSNHSSWTIVGYLNPADNTVLTAADATRRFNSISAKQSAIPLVEFQGNSLRPKYRGLQGSKKVSAQTRPEMKSNEQVRLEAERLNEEIKTAQTRALYATIVVPTCALALFIAALIVHKKNTLKRETGLIYELDEAEQQKHSLVQESLGLLSKCQRVWRIEASSATWEWKRNAGASSLIRRSVISIRSLSPLRVKTNVQVPSIDFGQSQLYFLPDTILYRDERGYGGISYNDFGVTQGFTRFIESEWVPPDAAVVDYTWQYVNKNGRPDRRFNNNRQLPVLQLGVLVMISSTGLNIQLNTSNAQLSAAFADSWQKQFQRVRDQQKQHAQSRMPPPKGEPLNSDTSAARKTLGVSDRALGAEISAAYHKLAQMYHPDKVAGLAPEFQTLADKRMKEVNAAYELLKNRG
jgi:hypothetical protein